MRLASIYVNLRQLSSICVGGNNEYQTFRQHPGSQPHCGPNDHLAFELLHDISSIKRAGLSSVKEDTLHVPVERPSVPKNMKEQTGDNRMSRIVLFSRPDHLHMYLIRSTK